MAKAASEGFTASQIAKQINGQFHKNRSRCAVQGKLHRLGLGTRAQKQAQKAGCARTPRSADPGLDGVPVKKPNPQPFRLAPTNAPPAALLKPPTAPVPTVASPDMPTLVQLGAGMCKWPLDDPGRGNMDHLRFCGDWRDAGEVYCPQHKRLSGRAA